MKVQFPVFYSAQPDCANAVARCGYDFGHWFHVSRQHFDPLVCRPSSVLFFILHVVDRKVPDCLRSPQIVCSLEKGMSG